MQAGHRLGTGFVHAILRQGQVHTADGIKRFLREVVRKSKRLGRVVDFRIDAGCTDGATLDLLTDEGLRSVGRLKSNSVLERMAAPLSGGRSDAHLCSRSARRRLLDDP